VGDFPWVHPNVVGHEVIGNAIWEQVFNKALFESYGASVNVDVSENYEFRCIVNNGDSEVSGVVVALGSAGECTLDSQCDDSIACTTDICNLPGTPESSCSTAPSARRYLGSLSSMSSGVSAV